MNLAVPGPHASKMPVIICTIVQLSLCTEYTAFTVYAIRLNGYCNNNACILGKTLI